MDSGTCKNSTYASHQPSWEKYYFVDLGWEATICQLFQCLHARAFLHLGDFDKSAVCRGQISPHLDSSSREQENIRFAAMWYEGKSLPGGGGLSGGQEHDMIPTRALCWATKVWLKAQQRLEGYSWDEEVGGNTTCGFTAWNDVSLFIIVHKKKKKEQRQL